MNTILETMSHYYPTLLPLSHAINSIQSQIHHFNDIAPTVAQTTVIRMITLLVIIITLITIGAMIYHNTHNYREYDFNLTAAVIVFVIMPSIVIILSIPSNAIASLTNSIHSSMITTHVNQRNVDTVAAAMHQIKKAYPYADKINVNQQQYVVYTNKDNLTVNPNQTLATNKNMIVTNDDGVINALNVGPNSVSVKQMATTSQQLPFIASIKHTFNQLDLPRHCYGSLVVTLIIIVVAVPMIITELISSLIDSFLY